MWGAYTAALEIREGRQSNPVAGVAAALNKCRIVRGNLVAANGQVIATSEAYERKQSAQHGIESVKENAPGAEVDDQTGE